MKGTIAICIREVVEKHFDAGTWGKVLLQAGLSEFRIFLTAEDVPNDQIVALMHAIVAVTGLSMDDVMNAFGDHWAGDYAPRLYAPYFARAKSARELLLNLHQIHETLTRTMPGAAPPKFTYEWRGEHHLIMHYQSQHGMVSLMPGIIRGVAKYYKESLDVSLKGNEVHIHFA
jgi:hypothetical protein